MSVYAYAYINVSLCLSICQHIYYIWSKKTEVQALALLVINSPLDCNLHKNKNSDHCVHCFVISSGRIFK